MIPHVAEIWCHPIKGHGREAIDEGTLTIGECRRSAGAHERSCFDTDRPRWQPCQAFSRGAKSPRVDPTHCMATTANPETGAHDADTLGALQTGWGHQKCGVYGVVTKSGALRQGDTVTVL